jgi:hypothetical protein
MSVDLKRDYREDLTLFEGPWSRALAGLLIAAVLAYALLVAQGFALYVLTTLCLFIIAALGLNLLVGYTGRSPSATPHSRDRRLYAHHLYTQGAPCPVSVLVAALAAGGFRLSGRYLPRCGSRDRTWRSPRLVSKSRSTKCSGAGST